MEDEKIQFSYRTHLFRLGGGETVEHLYDELGFVYVVESLNNVPYAIKCHDAATLMQHKCPKTHALEVLKHMEMPLEDVRLEAYEQGWEVSWPE